MINLNCDSIANITKMMKIHFLCLDKSGSYIKICTREHFQSFYDVFYAASHLILRGENCPGGEILQKEEEREHKDSGKKKKKKFATAEND